MGTGREISASIQRQNEIELNLWNIHRLIVTALVISLKLTHDYYNATDMINKRIGIDKKELCHMESRFLTMIDWDLL